MTSGWHLGITMGLASSTALGVAVVGCKVLTEDASPDDAGVFEGAETSTPVCGDCLAARCTAVMALCLTDEGCLDVHACAGTSGCDETCRTSCACSASAADGGVSAEVLYRAYTACTEAVACTACGADCAETCASGSPAASPGPCGPPADAGYVDGAADGSATADADAGTPPAIEGCASCAGEKCVDAMKACAIGSECVAFLRCVHACDRAGCVAECGALHATGQVAATELAACARAGCIQTCEPSNP